MIHYLSREAWGGKPVGWEHDHRGTKLAYPYAKPNSAFKSLFVHHTVIVMPDYDHDAMPLGDLDDVKAYMHMLQFARMSDLGPEVPYSWVVFEDVDPLSCVIAEGRGRGRVGAHTAGYNSSSYGVALAGNYDVRDITPGMVAGVRLAGTWLADPLNAPRTRGHRDVRSTACPGRFAYAKLAEMQPPFTPGRIQQSVQQEEDEMDEATKQEFRKRFDAIDQKLANMGHDNWRLKHVLEIEDKQESGFVTISDRVKAAVSSLLGK